MSSSVRSRIPAWFLCISAGLFGTLECPTESRAAFVSAESKVFGPVIDFQSGAANGLTIGRACVRQNVMNGGGPPHAQDPGTACAGGTRAVPPSLSATYTVGLVIVAGQGTGIELILPSGKKIIATAFVAGAAVLTDVVMRDPITINARPQAYSAPIMQALDSLRIETAVVEGAVETASYHREFKTNLTGSSPLYTLDVTAQAGSTPVADFQVSPTLASQGWNEASLEAGLNQALAAGTISPGVCRISNYSFPTITIAVPANTELILETEDAPTAARGGTAIPTLNSLGALVLFLVIALTSSALLRAGLRRNVAA